MYANRDEPKVLSQIAFALLPAFQTFRAEMIARLLAFFNEIIVGSTLQTLREIRGDIKSSRGNELRYCPSVQTNRYL